MILNDTENVYRMGCEPVESESSLCVWWENPYILTGVEEMLMVSVS